jgi:chromate transporter
VEAPAVSADVVLQLLREFAELSLLAFGGAPSIVPELHRQVVEVNGWATSEQFSQLYGLAQAAPGPNLLIVSLVGWKVAGVPGAFAALVGMCAPASVLTYAVFRLWHRQQDAKWRVILSDALLPVTLGLLVASAFLLTLGAGQSPAAYGVVAATAAVMLWGRIHPLVCIAAGALLGYAGLL